MRQVKVKILDGAYPEIEVGSVQVAYLLANPMYPYYVRLDGKKPPIENYRGREIFAVDDGNFPYAAHEVEEIEE